MADEASIRSSLQINNLGNLDYNSLPSAFNADVSAVSAPTPGSVTATVAGVDVDLSELTIPGFCRVQNLDATNFVEAGIWDGISFYPLMDLLAGETYVIRLSASIGQEFGTGTGTTGAAINTFRLKADTATCICLVEAFEK